MTEGGASARVVGGEFMYESRFGLRERPFRAVPSTECYYPATTHEQALAQLLQAVKNDEGLLLLTGEPGTGKTTVCLCLLERIGKEHTCAFITHGHFAQPKDMVQAILYDLSLDYLNLAEEELRLLLIDYAVKSYEAGKRTILVLDEAQHLGADLLEELRLLSNLDGNRGKAIQVVLAAQPSVLDTLARPELAAFNQRLAVRAHLEPLGVHEASDYLVHNLRSASDRAKSIFSDEAIEVLVRGARGIPRLLNRVAERALELASASEGNEVDVEAAMEALTVLGLTEELDGAPDQEELLCSDASQDLEQDPAATSSTASWNEKTKKEPAGNSEINKEANRARRLFAPPRRPA
jgi:general secretion pathway protein A